jgi:peptide-methionine (S)-S-oxide reductase
MKVLTLFFTVLLFVTQVQASTSVVLGGGCFWCMEPPYDSLKGEGVLKTTVGYAGGKLENPTYKQVSAGKTQHLEVIKIDFDPERISLEKIYDIFWRNIDPYDEGGQFCDRGRHYRAAVFLANDKQKKAFELSKKKVLKKLGSSKTLSVLELENINFFEAEDYHQDYYQKKPIRYKFYRYNCGRDDRLESVWGD